MRKYSTTVQPPSFIKGTRDVKKIVNPGRIIGVNSISDMVKSVLAWTEKPSHMEIATKIG